MRDRSVSSSSFSSPRAGRANEIITKVASHVHGHDAHEVLALVELPQEELAEEEEQHEVRTVGRYP